MSKKYNSRRVLQIVGSLIGVFSAIIGIYVFYFEDKVVSLEYEVIANTNVLDINADVSKVDVTYNGASLKSKTQNLRIINLRIINNGTECILKSHYDNNAPLGVLMKSGKIIERPELINTSNDYLKNQLKINYDSTGQVTFNDVILEPGQFYSIKLLVLHPSSTTPSILATGKIAGQNIIPIVSTLPKEEKSFWAETFGGGIISQFTRALCYTIAFLALIIGLGVFATKISDKRRARKRKRITKDFKESNGYEYNKMDDAIFSHFIELDEDDLWEFQSLLKDQNEIRKLYDSWKDHSKIEKNGLGDPETRYQLIRHNNYLYSDKWNHMHHMIKEGFLFIDDGTLSINRQMKSTLEMFLNYLKSIKYSNPNKDFRGLRFETTTPEGK